MQICTAALNSHLKPSDGDSTFWQWPDCQGCDFEGKGHGIENGNHSESLWKNVWSQAQTQHVCF